ncbi:MAG TPA: hypothetical protein VFH73_13275 [Polyangia bacterium]|nr:hypothetical protein [Polyangia bacterium]
MPSTKFLLGITTIASALVMGLGGSAAAQTCTTDKDCPQSFTCVDSGVTTTSGTIAPDCPPGSACPKVAPPPSTPMVIKSCQPKACTADANCGPGMVCHTQSYTECSGGGAAVAPCPPNTACDPIPTKPVPTNCVTKTVSACAFKWQLPCNTSADCGDRFTCKPMVTGCASSSSATTGPANGSGGSAPPATATAPATSDPPDFAPRKPADADGGTAPGCPPVMETFPGYCAPTATTCANDSECPASWKCTEYNLPGTASTRPAPGAPSDSTSSGGGTSTGAPTPVSSPPAPVDAGSPMTVRECTSPYGGVRGDTASGAPGSAVPPQAGSSTPPAPSGGTKGAAESASSSGGACSLNPTGSTSGAGGLALAALLGLLIARRRK